MLQMSVRLSDNPAVRDGETEGLGLHRNQSAKHLRGLAFRLIVFQEFPHLRGQGQFALVYGQTSQAELRDLWHALSLLTRAIRIGGSRHALFGQSVDWRSPPPLSLDPSCVNSMGQRQF
jgi:hypothetical protein